MTVGFADLQAAGTAEGDKEASEATVQTVPDQAQQGAQQAQQGLQEGMQAPPEGPQSSFGIAEAGAGGAPLPSTGQQGGEAKSESAQNLESNPYR